MPILRAKKAKTTQRIQSFMVQPEEIAKVAYELYQQRGCQPGHELDDWLEAEAVVQRQHAAQNNGSK